MPEGYYDLNGDEYYYLTDRYGTPKYAIYEKNDWDIVEDEAIPYELTYSVRSENYYLGDEYYSEYDFTDFLLSDCYKELMYPYGPSSGYYQTGGDYYYHEYDNSSSGWYIYDDDSDKWTSVFSDDIPEDLWAETSADDFYYTPDWSTETQINDFDLQPSESASSSSSSSSWWDSISSSDSSDDWWSSSSSSWDDDDDWSWSSSDSWDSGYSDWDSDW